MSDEEKEWLSNFNEEYLSGNFNHKGKRLHRTKKEKRECYGRNNARNRDLFTILRTRGWVNSATNDVLEQSMVANPEEALVELIDIRLAAKKT